MRRRVEGCRSVFLEPKKLRRFHFRGNTIAHRTENVMPQGVDSLRLSDGAMVHPDDNIPFRLIRMSNEHWAPVFSDQNKGTGGVHSDAGDLRRIASGFRYDLSPAC
jgi:hypothetical protein